MPDHESEKADLESLENDLEAAQSRGKSNSPFRTELGAPVSPISPSHPDSASREEALNDGKNQPAQPTTISAASPEKSSQPHSETGSPTRGELSKLTGQGNVVGWAVGAIVAVIIVWLLYALLA